MEPEATKEKSLNYTSFNPAKYNKLKCATPSVIRKGLCMVKTEGKHLEKQRGAKRKSLLDYSCKLAHSAVKYGSEIANSCDPLAAAIAVGGKSGIGVALSRFSASQCAGLIGVIVTSITPHASVPLILKKISEDLECLKKSLDIVRENPTFLAHEFLSVALKNLDSYNFDEALKHLELANYEATKGIHMAPTFKGLLGCIRIRIFSSVMIECASRLEDILCFSPLNCLSDEAKRTIEHIIHRGLETIMQKAKTRMWNGKFKILSKTQDIIDPYLAALYNTYSLASSMTDPYYRSDLEPPESIKFKIDSTYIPEGENDSCKLELLLHDTLDIVIFLWKEFKGRASHVYLRHHRSTWSIDATHGSIFDMIFEISENIMKANGKENDRLVQWPAERKSVKDLMKETQLVEKGKIKALCKKTYKWIERVPEQYLQCMDVDLNEQDNNGRTLLHALAYVDEFRNMERLMQKVFNIDATDKNGATPLHIACYNSSFQAAKILISNGADVNALTKNGNSPLMYLAGNKKHSISLIKMLIEYNAKRYCENEDGMRAIDMVTSGNSSDYLKKLFHPS